ncbi:MAG: MMPL family transporter [Acidobacteriota bacterium]|jgi:predicted RND superfamily exporter protein
MSRLRQWVDRALDRPRLVLSLFVVVTICWALGLPRLRLETDGRALLPPDHAALAVQQRMDARFTRSDFLVVGISAGGEQGIFTARRLDLVSGLSRAIADVPGVEASELRSLSTEISPTWSERGLHLEPPLNGRLSGPSDVRRVRRIVETAPLIRRILVAEDGRGAAIYVPLEEGADRRRVVGRIEDLLADTAAGLPAPAASSEPDRVRFHLLGPAAAESLLGEHVLHDLSLLLPVALATVALLLWLWFRWLPAVFLGLGEAGAVVTWTLGAMGLADKGLSLVTVVMPVILVTYCVADTIHIVHRFRDRLDAPDGSTRPVRVALGEALDEVLRPVVLTSLTTAAGFFAFAVSPIPPLRDFGILSGFGVLSALAMSLFAVPAGILLADPSGASAKPRAPRSFLRGLAAVTGMTVRRPALTVAAGVVLSGVLAAGLPRVGIADSWIANFDPESPVVRSDRWFNEQFLGSNIVTVELEPATEGGVFDPAFLGSLAALQDRLADEPAVGGTISLADQMRAVADALEDEPRLPRSYGEAEEWSLLLRFGGGEEMLVPYLDRERSGSNLWIFLNRADSKRTETVLSRLRAGLRAERDVLSVGGVSGDAYLGHVLVGLIATSQRSSLLTALAVTLCVVWLVLRSLRAALLVVLPVLLAVLWNFGYLGWIGLPLGVATSTFSVIALGIGIDFALHWHETLRLRRKAGAPWARAVAETAESAGGAILLNGVVLLCGFGILLVSAVPPNRHLAQLISINLLACLVATLFLLPALMTLLRMRRPVNPAADRGVAELGRPR